MATSTCSSKPNCAATKIQRAKKSCRGACTKRLGFDTNAATTSPSATEIADRIFLDCVRGNIADTLLHVAHDARVENRVCNSDTCKEIGEFARLSGTANCDNAFRH